MDHSLVHFLMSNIKMLENQVLEPRNLEVLERVKDLNPRPQPWQGCALPLSYTRIHRVHGYRF